MFGGAGGGTRIGVVARCMSRSFSEMEKMDTSCIRNKVPLSDSMVCDGVCGLQHRRSKMLESRVFAKNMSQRATGPTWILSHVLLEMGAMSEF